MKRRSRLALSIGALLVAAGAASGQPLRLDYDVEVVSPGLYSYTFTCTVDTTLGTWNPGMGWSWYTFFSGRRSSFVPTSPNFAMTTPWPVGPWTQLTSVGGGHNGPMFGPASPTTYWIPTSAGESISWSGTSPVYVEQGDLRFSTVIHTGGAVAVNFREANRVPTVGSIIGACCLADGSCITVTQTGCTTANGVYNGDNTTCGSTNCLTIIPTGACCRESGCVILPAAKCTSTGGVYAGNNVPCSSAGCTPVANANLAPPDFVAGSRVWTYAPSHTKTISGAGFRATGFRLKTNMDRGIEGWQSDILMELVAPNGTTLLIGGDSTSPLVANSIRWASIRRSGTGPSTNNNAGNIDGTYSWDFGPADGVWTVNFWNNYAHTGSPNVPPRITWNNINVELLDAGAGACCLPSGSCIDTAIGNCTLQNGIYRGDNAPCSAAGCEPYLWAGPSTSSLTGNNVGIFMDLTGGQPLNVHKIDYYSTATAGTPATVEVWTYPGSYANRDGDPNGWVLHDTVSTVSGGTANPASLNLATPIAVPAGDPVGVYLIAQTGGLRYHSAVNQSNIDIAMLSERTRTLPWAGTLATSRALSGHIYYSPTCTTGICPRALMTPAGTSATSTNNNGIFFDLTAQADVTISRIDYYAGSAAATPTTAALYIKQGTYVGFDTNPGAWTFVGTFEGTSGAGNYIIPMDFSTLNPPFPNIQLQDGEVLGVYVVGTVGGYRFLPATAPEHFSDANMTLSSNIGRSALFSGTLSTGRRFAGRVHYTAGSGTPPCYANCDGSTVEPILNVADFSCFLSKFAAGDPYANCDGSTIEPVLNVADFSCFLGKFAAGCR